MMCNLERREYVSVKRLRNFNEIIEWIFGGEELSMIEICNTKGKSVCDLRDAGIIVGGEGIQ